MGMEIISTANSTIEFNGSDGELLNKKSKNKSKNLKMSFEELIAKVMEKLFPHAMVLTGHDEDKADDLIGIMAEKLFNNKERFMAVKKPMAYAKKVITNSYIDIYRKENIQLLKDKGGSYTFDENGYPINVSGERVQKGNDFDKKNSVNKNVSIEENHIQLTNEGFQEESIKFERMIECLKKFNAEEQIILTMVGFEWSYEEIHDYFEIYTLANIKQKIFRARIKLAKNYGKQI